jgi:hypothetical protein
MYADLPDSLSGGVLYTNSFRSLRVLIQFYAVGRVSERRPLVSPDPFADASGGWRSTRGNTGLHFSGRDLRPAVRCRENSLCFCAARGSGADVRGWMLVTGLGWAVAGSDLEPAIVSRFRGRVLSGESDFLWALAAGSLRIPVRGGISKTVPDRTWVHLKRTPLPPDAQIPNCFPLEDGGCIDEKFLHAIAVAQLAKIAGEERWIEVNIADQTLTAYEGRRPVYFTMVSTGRRGADTIRGNNCIQLQAAWQDIDKKECEKLYLLLRINSICSFYRGVFAFHPFLGMTLWESLAEDAWKCRWQTPLFYIFGLYHRCPMGIWRWHRRRCGPAPCAHCR